MDLIHNLGIGFGVAFVGLLGTALLVGPVEHGTIPFWWLAAPLMLMGLSQGMTISPNQTLTLNSVDPRFGGVAGVGDRLHGGRGGCGEHVGGRALPDLIGERRRPVEGQADVDTVVLSLELIGDRGEGLGD